MWFSIAKWGDCLIKEKTTLQKIYQQLRDDITFGKFTPGEHLSEKVLTQEYGVSRTSMREIIGQLSAQGYLTFEPNRGAIVTRLSLDDVDVIYNILIRCESYSAALFAERWEKPSYDALETLHERMRAIDVNSKYKVWLGLNNQFHELIHKKSGSSILWDLIYHTRLRIYRFRMFKTEPENAVFYNGQHHEILLAIHDRKGGLVERLMANHLESARKRRLKILKEYYQLLHF